MFTIKSMGENIYLELDQDACMQMTVNNIFWFIYIVRLYPKIVIRKQILLIRSYETCLFLKCLVKAFASL